MIAAVRNLPAPQPAPAPPAPGLDDEYRRIDAFIPALSQMAETNPQQWSTQLLQLSQATRGAFMNELRGTREIPAAGEAARTAVLAAIQAGLLAGALDAVLVYTLRENPFPDLKAPAQMSLPQLPDPGELGKEIQEALREAWDRARQALELLGKEALHTGSGLAKAAGRQELELADQLAAHREDLPVEAYQAYLAQAFLTGYTVSALDATLLLKAGETPRS